MISEGRPPLCNTSRKRELSIQKVRNVISEGRPPLCNTSSERELRYRRYLRSTSDRPPTGARPALDRRPTGARPAPDRPPTNLRPTSDLRQTSDRRSPTADRPPTDLRPTSLVWAMTIFLILFVHLYHSYSCKCPCKCPDISQRLAASRYFVPAKRGRSLQLSLCTSCPVRLFDDCLSLLTGSCWRWNYPKGP